MNTMLNCGAFFSRLNAIDQNTSILDNFNRADTGPPPGAGWASIIGIPQMKVVSNRCQANSISALCGNHRNGEANLADGELGITIIDKVIGVQLIARVANPSADYIVGGYTTGWICGNSISSVLTTTTPNTKLRGPTAGDQIIFRYIGTRIELFVRPGGRGRLDSRRRDDHGEGCSGEGFNAFFLPVVIVRNR